jgi:hypothetical protein
MDKQVIALFIPILALSIPVVALVMAGFHRYAKMRMEEARLRASGAGDPGQLDAMRGEMDDMRRELSEVQERLDFAERLLARPETRDRAPQQGP